MYFAQQMFNVIQDFSGTENSISINKVYLRYTGDLQTGAFLSQVVYWCDKSSRKDGFFYKSYEEWKSELYMSEYSIRKAVKELKSLGILETKLIKANGSPTLHYKLNKTKFTQEIISFLNKENSEKAVEVAENKGENNDETVVAVGFCENEESILRNQRIHSANSKNPFCENEETLTSLTTSPTTSLTNSKKKCANRTSYDSQFEEFWKLYPKKSSKKKAYEAFNRVMKKHSYETILSGLEKYVSHIKKTKIESRYILHGASFLNGERFNDEYDESDLKGGKRVNDPNDFGAEALEQDFNNENKWGF